MQVILDAIRDIIMAQPDDCGRIFHGRGHCYSGLEWITVDWYKPLVWVCLFEEPNQDWLLAFKQSLQKLVDDSKAPIKQSLTIQLQHRYQKGAPVDVLLGAPVEELVCQEYKLKFKVRFGGQQNTGLFIDMANGRKWVYENSAGARVLNLFAYTCAFSVAAIAGGAQQVVNIDMAKGALSWGRDNHRLNTQSTEKVKFFAHDVLKSWGKLKKFGPYDLIIVDPPSFQRGSFVAQKDYVRLSKRLAAMLAEGGNVVACLNAPELDTPFLKEVMENGGFQYVMRIPNPNTFPEENPEKGLKTLLFTA